MAGEDKAVKNDTGAEKATKPTNIKKIVLIVVSVIVGLIVLVIIIATLATSGARKASDNFIKDIQTKNVTAGYAELSKNTQSTITQEQFKQVVDQIGPVLSGKPNNQGSETKKVNGKDTATVTYTIKGSDGNTYKITVNLVKEDSSWKVEVFNSEKQ
jgi:hypothetical protein